MIDSDFTTRKKQLGFFDRSYVIKQDQELIDLIRLNTYKKALGVGDIGYFAQFIDFVDCGPVDFCMYIQLDPFDFDDLIDNINAIIKKDIVTNGLIYLSLNKYIALPRCYDASLPDDYDQAIKEFITTRVNATVEKYFSCGQDQGNMFNGVHPLTRFYLRTK